MKITRILNLGAGVQSSTLALMPAHGEIEAFDCALFADTQYEPQAVYQWLDWLEAQLPYPVHRVTAGDLRNDQLIARANGERTQGQRWGSIPYFTTSSGMVKRQCSTEYKVESIERFIRCEILGLKPRQHAPKHHVIDQCFGISYDEPNRMKVPFVVPWKRNVYPLYEMRMTRGHCLEWMEKRGYPVPPRSACLCCPYHSDEEWLRIKDGPPNEWASVIEFDRGIRHAKGMRSESFLHRDRKPIDEVDFTTPKSSGQVNWIDECEGICGV